MDIYKLNLLLLITLTAYLVSYVHSSNTVYDLCRKRLSRGKQLGSRCASLSLNDEPTSSTPSLSQPSSRVEESDVCPRKQHLIGGRVCKRACTHDSQCRGKRKRCVCDDVCGLTCLNPKGKCPSPSISNGRAKISGRNQLGAVTRYTCSKGYILEGVETRICNGDRDWSGTAPRCVPKIVSSIISDQNMDVSDDKILTSDTVQCPEPPSVAFADHNGPKQTHFSSGTEVIYKCRAGFVSEGIAIAQCMTSGAWVGPLMSCKEEICSELGDLDNGVKYGSSKAVGAKVNYECSKGYRLIGSPTLTCKRGGQWDNSKPICQQSATSTCTKPRTPRHGTKIGRSYSIGNVVTIVCDVGYKVSGSSKRVCQENGLWSGTEPDCIPVNCGQPGQLYNGYIDGRRYTYGSVIRYRCLDGTKFDGLAMSATCLETGQWSFPVPRCLRSCARPNVPNAEVFVDSRSAPLIVDHGDKLQVVCSEGLAPNDDRRPVCNNGTWSSLPTCVQGGCDHRPKEIANGMALYRGTKFGDRVRYMCNAGHKLMGDKYLTCEGGEWKGRLPQCKAVYCPHPGDLANGKILLVGDIGKFEYRPYVRHAGQGEKIEYYCSTGFRLDGPSAATCIDGQWSPESRPTCIDNQHPMLPGTQEIFTQ